MKSKNDAVKVNKIKNSSARLNIKQREKPQINKMRNESGNVTTDLTEMKKTIKTSLRTIICQEPNSQIKYTDFQKHTNYLNDSR